MNQEEYEANIVTSYITRDCRRRRSVRLQVVEALEEGLHVSLPTIQFTHAADSIPFITFSQKHYANNFNTAMSKKIQ